MKKITALVLALIMAVAAFASCKKEEEETSSVTVPEKFDPAAVAVSSGDTELTSGDLSYILNSEYQAFLYELAESNYTPSLVKLDTSVSLREQPFGMGNGFETWYDYFADTARESAEEAVTLASAAKASGISLNEEETAAIDSSVSEIMKNAENAETSREAVLGYGVTEENVRRVLTVTAMASKYLETNIAAADISDEAIDTLYEKYKYSYEKIDYMVYAFDYRDLCSDDATAAEKEAAKTTSREYADTMAALTDEESFKAYALDNMVNVLGLSESEAQNQITRNLTVKDATYDEKDPLMVWGFSAEVGDVLVEVREDEVIELHMLFAYNDRNENVTARDVRHILFTRDTYKDDTKVREVYDKWVADGAKVEDFKALAAEYSEDPGSKDNGGLYEGIISGETVEEFDNWLFSSNRKEGDHGIVESAEYGWHIMYYEGGEPTWRKDMIEHIQNEAYVAAITSARESHPATTDEERINNLPA